MLDIAFTELLLILGVAFLILGPKELPQVIRALSKFMRECREVIDECKSQLEGMAEDSGAKEVVQSLEAEKRYITDQFGELREVYDVRDVVAQGKARRETSPPPVGGGHVGHDNAAQSPHPNNPSPTGEGT